MTVKEQASAAMEELLQTARLRPGDLVVVGCSSSEIVGEIIGTHSDPDAAGQVLAGILPPLQAGGLYLAAQCCEHLNRALIVEEAAALRYGLQIVNAVPQKKAGGSFATAAWHAFRQPVAVEAVQARAGLDIGGTLIGMHLAPVAVPVRLKVSRIGNAILLAARSRPKYIGGERAVYDDRLR